MSALSAHIYTKWHWHVIVTSSIVEATLVIILLIQCKYVSILNYIPAHNRM